MLFDRYEISVMNKSLSRQRRRKVEVFRAFQEITDQYGGEPRKNRRRMARALVRNRRSEVVK